MCLHVQIGETATKSGILLPGGILARLTNLLIDHRSPNKLRRVVQGKIHLLYHVIIQRSDGNFTILMNQSVNHLLDQV